MMYAYTLDEIVLSILAVIAMWFILSWFIALGVARNAPEEVERTDNTQAILDRLRKDSIVMEEFTAYDLSTQEAVERLDDAIRS